MRSVGDKEDHGAHLWPSLSRCDWPFARSNNSGTPARAPLGRVSDDHRDGKKPLRDGDVLSVPALHQNGTTISVEFTIIPLKNESGAMIGLAAICRDVTKRFEETRALKRRLAEATKGNSDSQ